MQIQRASMSQVVEPTAASLRPAAPPQQPAAAASPKSVTAAATPERGKTEDVPRHHATKAPAMPEMNGSDRAAIASSTGFYISPTGEVTPDGMPPWSFIMATLEKRHTAGTTEPAAPAQAAGTPSAATGEGVDVLA
jgi:hypothetical protein